jgi:hypothetical protein
MTPLFPAQRAAEEFDQVLGGTSTAAVSDRYADLLETVEVLRAQPEVLPRAEFVGELRARLLLAAEAELVRAPPVVRDLEAARTTRRRRKLGAVAASLVIVGGSAGMAAAAAGSLPGDPLYPVKRGLEQAGTVVRTSEASKGEALLDQARARLAEVRDLQARGAADDEVLATSVADYVSAANEGSQKLFTAYQADGDTGDIETVRTFTTEEMADVAALAKDSDKGLDGLLVDVADTLADIDQQARVLCATCGPDSPVEPPAALSADVVGGTVDNLLADPVAQARADITAAEAARIAGLQRLTSAAEATAVQIPRDQPGGSTSLAGAPSAGDGVASRLITRDGAQVPSLTDGTAVTGLVSGVTASVDKVTGTLSSTLSGTVSGTLKGATDKLTEPRTPLDPLDPALKGLNDELDETTGKLLP